MALDANTQQEDVQDEAADLLNFVTYKISRVHPKLNAQAAHILREQAGLSLLQWRLIALLEVMGPNISSVELINLLHMDKGLFSRTLKSLIAEGYVASLADDADRRRSHLSNTNKGKQVYERVIATMRKRQEHLLHNFTDAEKSALFQALDKLEANAQRRDF